jgi:hypothetical protein
LPNDGLPLVITVPQVNSQNIKGFILTYGTTIKQVSYSDADAKAVYVAIDNSGKMTGFYPTIEDMKNGTNKTNITLNTEGKWLFAIRYFIDSEYKEYNFCGNQDVASMHNIGNAMRWTLDVRPTPVSDPTVVVPTVDKSVKDSCVNIISHITTDFSVFADDIGQNQAYVMDVGISTLGSDKQITPLSTYGNVHLETLKVPLAQSIVAPVEGVRIDFDKTAYVKDIKLNAGMSYLLYDVLGSLDGENWFVISKDNTASSSEFTVNVDSAVKNLRVDYRDYNDHWGKITTSLTAVNGIINVFPTETYTVTFKHVVSEEGEAQLSDATATSDQYGAYAVPSPFDNNVYEYFANASCTIKFDVTQKVANNTTVYVRLASSNPDPDIEGVVKLYAVNSPKGYCGVNFIERPINDIYVGNKIIISPVAKYSTVPVFGGKNVAKVQFYTVLTAVL